MALSTILASTFRCGGMGLTFRKLMDQAHDVVLANWDLGLTSFGGPPVHFQIVCYLVLLLQMDPNDRTDRDEAQSSGEDSSTSSNGSMTRRLPGAIGMFCFSLGVSRLGDQLPVAVFALLSGLNAATVGIIALAAVQLSRKVITDKLTRVLVFLGGAGGMLYTALWYFPTLMAAAGIATMTWDSKVLQNWARRMKPRERRRAARAAAELAESRAGAEVSYDIRVAGTSAAINPRADGASTTTGSSHLHQLRHHDTRGRSPSVHGRPSSPPSLPLGSPLSPERNHAILSWQSGVILLLTFSASFLAIMLIRGLVSSPTRPFSIFANLYLAGTIIFGGGPVVIPLLRAYIVAEGWVSPRNFLLGLALIQAFPGPNFNFAVYLGALATTANTSPLIGATVAFLGIFLPGLVVQSGFMGLWGLLRKNRALLSVLRGVNAAAVGLVFTAVYRLWQIGYLSQNKQDGQPLGGSPWWVVVTATSFVGGTWFGLNPPSAVVLGGVMGMVWYGVVARG